MSKISDITKVSKTKHVDVDDQTQETQVDVHKDISKEKKSTSKKDIPTEMISTKENAVTDSADFDPKKMRIVFMGTGIFAGNILEAIGAHTDIKKLTIITQPDKKIGRKKSSIHRSLAANPVREFAIDNNIDLYQPQILDKEAINKISSFKPDIIIVSSYGKILPEEILKIPRFNTLNVHASLLPKLRGASPVQNALFIGLKKTGVTIMKVDKGLDTGDILAQKEVKIQEHEKADELLIRLSKIGALLLIKTAEKWITGTIDAKPQDSKNATLCQLIDREDGHIQWTKTTEEVYNAYRALFPWPGIFTYWEITENQLMRIKFRSIYPITADLTEEQRKLMPGTVFIGHDQLCVKTFDTAIIVEAVQPECKAVMPVYDFLNGHNDFEGAVLR